MKKSFIEKVIREGIIDTKAYRYVADPGPDALTIRRLPLEYLDTTAALDGWEIVQVIK